MSTNPRPRVYEPVEVYRTADGKDHPTPAKARDHAADCCREVLDKALAGLDPARFTRNDRFTVIMALIPDAETGKALADALRRQFP